MDKQVFLKYFLIAFFLIIVISSAIFFFTSGNRAEQPVNIDNTPSSNSNETIIGDEEPAKLL